MARQILSPKQVRLLEEIAKSPFLANNFYLTRGTALAAFYIRHRYSKDLDFFSETEVDLLNLGAAIKKLRAALKISKVDFQQSYNRNLYFFNFGKEIVKVEFTLFPFKRIENGKKIGGIFIDSFLDIAVNKLFTIYQRSKARDYIDLYCICKKEGWPMTGLIKQAKIKFDWHIDSLQLGTQFVKAGEARDFPRMIKKISPKMWQGFFVREAKKLGKEIVNRR